MDRITRAMPSPALVVAALALIAALAGTALAGSGPSATTSGKADKALKRAKKANKKANAAQNAPNRALGQQDTFAYATNDTATTTTVKRVDTRAAPNERSLRGLRCPRLPLPR